VFTEPETASSKCASTPTGSITRVSQCTRSERYRYNVREVRSQVDITVLKGEVYLDGQS